MLVRRLHDNRLALAALFFLVVTLLLFWPFLTGNAFLWNDFAEYTYPTQVFAARSVAAGAMPWWNPYSLNGMPFIADPQVGFYYPINQVMYHLAHGMLTTTLLQSVVVLHYFIAMLGMWVLARGLGIGAWGATVSGVAYALSGPMMAHMIHPNMVEQLAWWPLAMHFMLKGMRRGSIRWAITSGLVLGLSFLVGHPQTAVYELFFLAAVVLWYAMVHRRTPGAMRRAALGVLSCALAIGVFAIQWLPSLELVQQSQRAELTYDQSLQDALAPDQLLTLIAPRFFGVNAPQAVAGTAPFWNHDGAPGGAVGARSYWETVIYVGVSILILVAAGLGAHQLRSFGWLLAGLAAIGLLYGLGDATPLHPLLARIPVIGTFCAPARLGMYLIMAAPLLAGAGVDALLLGAPRAIHAALITAGGIALVAALVVTGIAGTALQVPAAVAGPARASGIVPLLLGLAVGGMIWLASRPGSRAKYLGPMCIALVLLDLGWLGPAENRGTVDPMRDVYQRLDIRYARLMAHPPFSVFRSKIRDYQSGDALVPRNQGLYSGMMLYDGYNPLRLAHQVPWATTAEQRLDLLDVRFDHEDGGLPDSLVERRSTIAHARMLFATRVFGDDSAAARAIHDGLNLDSVVVLDTAPPFPIEGGSGTATLTRYDAGVIEVDVSTSAPGILLLSDIWYPAWRADVDGTPTRLMRADGALRAVAVAAGQHRVSMVYASATARTGATIAGATLLFAAAGLLLGRLATRTEMVG